MRKPATPRKGTGTIREERASDGHRNDGGQRPAVVISRTMKTREARLPTVSGRRAATQDVRTCWRKEVGDEGRVFSDTGSI